MKKIFFIFYFLFVSLFVFAQEDILLKFAPKTEGIIKYKFFYVDFNSEAKAPNWTIYKAEQIGLYSFSRTGLTFKQDPRVENSVKYSEYKFSGYDAGHFVPAADMTFDKDALTETFFTTNIAPQKPNFNRGIWKNLEKKIREEATSERIIVLTGAIYSKEGDTIGESKIKIPDAFFKVVYYLDNKKIVCYFLFHNCDKIDLINFVVPTSTIEEKAKIKLRRFNDENRNL